MFEPFISDTSTNNVAQRVAQHRDKVYQMFVNRYMEFLPLIINYSGIDDLPIKPSNIETILRQGVGVAIGMTKSGQTAMLGYVQQQNQSNPINGLSLVSSQPLYGGDIAFIIDKDERLEHYKEITYHDNFKSGNFVVLYNKPFTFTCNNDYQIIDLYCDRLAEISLSRYSIYMQSKVSHVIKGEADDEDIEQIANDLLNGKPFIKTSTYFDEDNVVEINSVSDVISALPELKREYQNNIAELNSILGLNSLGVDKEAGVSSIEAQSNMSFKKANEAIYLKARNEPLKHYNNKFGTRIQAEYNDLMVSELSSLERVTLDENNTSI